MKRQRIEIMAQILVFCVPPRRKTRIMYKNNLSHTQIKDYLSLLTSRNLLAHNSGEYVTTEKGHRFLEVFAQLKDVLEGYVLSSSLEISKSYEVGPMSDGSPMSRDAREMR